MDISLLKAYDYFESLQYRYKMIRKYPFLSAFSVGKSVMGREIPAFSVGNADEYALLLGGVHGNAHFTCAILMAFLDELCSKIQQNGIVEGIKVRKALVGKGLIVVPCLNPDGCEIATHGKAAMGSYEPYLQHLVKNDYGNYIYNARGTDIDLAFSAPLKEPESAALYSLCENNNIRHAVILDKGGGEIVMPSNSPQRSSRMAEIMVSSSGYNLKFANENLSNLHLTEWFCQKYSAPAFSLLSNAEEDNYLKLYTSLRELLMLVTIM